MLSTTVEYTDAMASRTRDPAATKAAILAAARMQFGQSGFEKTTIRSVASAAGVDPALVMHYFGNKDGLFAAVSRLDISPPDLSGVAPALADVAIDRPAERAALIGAHLLGIAVARYIIGIPPLVDMDDKDLAQWLKPVLTHYLTDPAP